MIQNQQGEDTKGTVLLRDEVLIVFSEEARSLTWSRSGIDEQSSISKGAITMLSLEVRRRSPIYRLGGRRGTWAQPNTHAQALAG